MNSPDPSSTLSSLPLTADQRAVLSQFLQRLRRTGSADAPSLSRTSAGGRSPDQARAEAEAELMSDNSPLGDVKVETNTAVASDTSTRARLLVISSNPHAPEQIAQAVAKDLGRDVIPVDLSRVVSKFIAETEKRLEELFDIAREDRSILFFDDADALFGGGGQAAASHFADQEVGYLLHHIEGFDGISVIVVNAGTPTDEKVQERFDAVIRC